MYYENFKNLYPVTKTVQFELVPDERTKEIIEKDGLLLEDEERNENIAVIKDLITECHKHFINENMAPGELQIDWTSLKDAYAAYTEEKTKGTQKGLSDVQKHYRKVISQHLVNCPGYKALKGTILFDVTLKEIVEYLSMENAEELCRIIDSFEGYTSFFQDFYDKKDRIYGDEEKEGTIAYRVVHENFPIWISAISIYEEMYEKYGEEMEAAYAELKQHITFFAEYSLPDVFTLDFYSNLLCAEGIAAYKKLINGIQISEDVIVEGLNKTASTYAQRNKEKVLKLPVLKKAIQTMDTSMNFSFDKIQNDTDCLRVLSDLTDSLYSGNLYDRICVFFNNLAAYDPNEIFIHKNMLSKVSVTLFGQWDSLRNLLRDYVEGKYSVPLKSKDKKAIEAWLNREYIPLSDIHAAISASGSEKTFSKYVDTLLSGVNSAKLLCAEFDEKQDAHLKTGVKLSENRDFKSYIKTYLESVNHVAETMKVFAVKGDTEKGDFYLTFDELYEGICELRTVYRMVRNYFMKKPYSVEKIKLNFGNQNLLGGWSSSVLNKNGGLILRKGRNYYLAIANKVKKANLETLLKVETAGSADTGFYDVFVTDVLPSVSKFVPKVLFTKAVKEYFAENTDAESYVLQDDKKFIAPITITNEVWQLYHTKKYTLGYAKETGDTAGFEDALKKWVALHLEVLLKHRSSCKFNFSEFAELEDGGTVKVKCAFSNMPEFTQKADTCMFRTSRISIPEEIVDAMTQRGDLLLFRIRNNPLDYYALYEDYIVKDLNTMYFLSLFTDKNLKENRNRMCGNAAIRYRRKSISGFPTHKKGETLVSKVDTDGIPVPSDVYMELSHYLNGKGGTLSPKAEKYLKKVNTKIAKEDIIKDKRFSVDKFLFTLPIDLNVKSANPTTITEFNATLNAQLRESDVSVLSICRGQDSLLNAALVAPDGNVVFSKNLDVINGHNYKAKFKKRRLDSLASEQKWNYTSTVKDLQEGYVSAVVPLVIQMALENNAVIAFADTRKLKKTKGNLLEDGAYDLLMSSVQKKLCFYVQKQDMENALQLCLPVEDKYVSVQNGIVFFVSPAQTKEIDPTTGYFNNLKFRDIARNARTKKEFICNLDNLEYEESTDSFVFTIDCSKYDAYVPSNDLWEIYTPAAKHMADKNGEIICQTPSADLKRTLKKMCLDIKSSKLIEEISEIEADKTTAWFFGDLFQAFAVSARMKVYDPKSGSWIITSPVRNNSGGFFESSIDADSMAAVALGMKTHVILDKVKAGDFRAVRIYTEEWTEALKNGTFKI